MSGSVQLAPYVPNHLPCKALLPHTVHKTCLMLTCIVFNSQRTKPDRRHKPLNHKSLVFLRGTPTSASAQSATRRSASLRPGFARGRRRLNSTAIHLRILSPKTARVNPVNPHPAGHSTRPRGPPKATPQHQRRPQRNGSLPKDNADVKHPLTPFTTTSALPNRRPRPRTGRMRVIILLLLHIDFYP